MGVAARDGVKEHSAVGDGTPHRTDLVERGAEGHDAGAGDCAVGRLDAHNSVQAGGQANRAARISSDRKNRLTGGDRGG
ncbi:hypothetical protein SDC9_165676 [bioreactor metagenome]|uniref:Uncharacterized protein n=1 Tax=bioreactor metagenome TaxID=1076179 RepID=A0A645FWS1_9ZZZZ